MNDASTFNRRLLLIDDNPAIHDDFRKIVMPKSSSASSIDQKAEALFEICSTPKSQLVFEMDFAFQGEEALGMVEKALAEERPYALAFVDMRMPPGWDGLETIRRIWDVYPELETVICTAYSDHSWEEIQRTLGHSDRLLILKKPFDKVEVQQLALALTEKWNLRRLARLQTQGLEDLVQVRTREVVAAYQSKSEFLTNLSHELITPMNGIVGMTELLAESTLTEDQREMLTDVQLSSNRLLNLINQVLQFNTINSGEFKLQNTSFNLEEVCQSAANTQAANARAKGLALEVSLDSNLPALIEGDPQHLQQILGLLLDNAVKFTKRGEIRISAKPGAAPSGGVRFAVIDTGCGIPKERVEELKSPFAQMDGSLTRKTEGLGVGLTLTKQLLSMIGSGLEIESTPGQGSSFRFTLLSNTGSGLQKADPITPSRHLNPVPPQAVSY